MEVMPEMTVLLRTWTELFEVVSVDRRCSEMDMRFEETQMQ